MCEQTCVDLISMKKQRQNNMLLRFKAMKKIKKNYKNPCLF